MPPPSPDPDSAGVFAAMLHASRSLLAMRDPLDAEIVVSEMLGAWWAQRPRGADAERVLGEGLIDFAAAQATPAAGVLLTAIAFLGRTRRQRVKAKRAVRKLLDQGTARPRWAQALGQARPGDCYLCGSRFGDTDDVICTFTYGNVPGADSAGPSADSDRHALIAVIDYNAGGILRDAWVTSKVDRLLEHARRAARDEEMSTFTPLDPQRAHAIMRSAIARTESALPAGSGGRTTVLPGRTEGAVPDPGAESLAAIHALLRARIRALPGRTAAPRRPAWLRDNRATLAVRFLASDEAEELSDSFAASRCADHIIDYGCDVDLGRPLRVSPRKMEAFLLTWLPRKVALTPEEQEAMPHVLAAWVRWAGPRTGLPPDAVRATLDTVWEATQAFADTYADHPAGGYGLRREVIRRLLPDGDLAAIPRRVFAFPLLASDLIPDKDHYDPATAAGRRALLRLDHFNGQQPSHGKHSTDAFGGSPELEEALDQHEQLAKRLWDGDPPNLWSAAQRLMDRGSTRVAVIEILIGAIERTEDAGTGAAGLVKLLDEL